jgi:hypothetical protein
MRPVCWLLSATLLGCGGFHPAGGGDSAAPADLSIPDGPSSDGATAADLSIPIGGSGPGPLGALPTGFCCSSSEQCRGRLCAALGMGAYYCADSCTDDTPCTGWSTQFMCDLPSGRCVPVNDPYTCGDGATFNYGAQHTGTCCFSAGTSRAGAECEGGLCLHVGLLSNPGFCSQGCDTNSPCPMGFGCHLELNDKGQCWTNASIADVNNAYGCN